jgi:hypothetical protein
MNRIPAAALLILAGAALGLASCSGPAAAYREYPAQAIGQTFAGVHYLVTEHAYDGPHELLPGRIGDVDADSDLVVRFKVPDIGPEGPEGPAWERLRLLLERLNDLSRRRELLHATEVDLRDVKKARETADAVRRFIDDLVAFLQTLGQQRKITDDEMLAILSGGFDGPPNPGKPYENLARWIRRERERLRREADEFLKGRERYHVAVLAFLDSPGQSTKPVHVDGYDHIPSGSLQPIDRYGVRLTPEEAAKLQSAIRSAEVTASLVREFVSRGPPIKLELRALLARELQAFRDLLHAPPAVLAERALAEARKLLQAIAGDEKEGQEIRTAAAELDKQLNLLSTEIPKARESLDALLALASGGPEAGFRPDAAFSRIAGLSDSIAAIVRAVTSLGEMFKKPGAADRILQALQGKGGEALRAWIVEKADRFKAFQDALDALREMLQMGGQVSAAQSALEPEDGKTISRDLGDLVDGRVELARAGRASGDRVTLKVRFLEQGPNGAWDRVVREETYRGNVVLVGLHREISASLIFERATSAGGDADRWKPGVAATVSWHYLSRDPESWFSRSLNFLNPGLGLHVASLNQTDQTVELGVGVNVSLFKGLLLAGYGFNLSAAKDREYYFFGLDLLETLNKAMGR